MPWCDPQVVGIPYDYIATGLLGLEAHVVYESQHDRMEPFLASRNACSDSRWKVEGKESWNSQAESSSSSNHDYGYSRIIDIPCCGVTVGAVLSDRHHDIMEVHTESE